MLPIVLVLLIATSALAAPSVNIQAVAINEVALPKNNGGLVSAYFTEKALELIDGGLKSAYILTSEAILNDLSNQNDRSSQALALAQTIGLLGATATGLPGDACAAATMIDAYVYSVQSGNTSGLRKAVANFIQSFGQNIDLIAKLSNDETSLRYVAGPRGNCNAGGRSYQFEAAWDSILANASPASASYVNEQYCAAKRLYNSNCARSNNVAAILTAVSLPPVNAIFQNALGPLAQFVQSTSSRNAGSYAGAAIQALRQAANY